MSVDKGELNEMYRMNREDRHATRHAGGLAKGAALIGGILALSISALAIGAGAEAGVGLGAARARTASITHASCACSKRRR